MPILHLKHTCSHKPLKTDSHNPVRRDTAGRRIILNNLNHKNYYFLKSQLMKLLSWQDCIKWVINERVWSTGGMILTGTKTITRSVRNLLHCHFVRHKSHTEWPRVSAMTVWRLTTQNHHRSSVMTVIGSTLRQNTLNPTFTASCLPDEQQMYK